MKNSELMQQIRIALMNYGKSDEFAMLVFQKEQTERAISPTNNFQSEIVTPCPNSQQSGHSLHVVRPSH